MDTKREFMAKHGTGRSKTRPVIQTNPTPKTEPTPAQKYGEFRVCWYYEGTEITLRIGDGLGWDEETATVCCGELKSSGREPWVEHQNPETGEWKRW